MIYITGDTHGKFDRLSFRKWSDSRNLTKEDYLIVLGDFGLIFNEEASPDEIYWQKWLNKRPFTTLFVDGNHENHYKLQQLQKDQKFGGEVGVVSDSIFHLRRGEVYIIEGLSFLTFGGATSIDKLERTHYVSWWPEEVPNYAEMDHCLTNIAKHNYCVDVILAHTCPDSIAPIIAGYRGYHLQDDPVQKMLSHIVNICTFKHYFCGHFHLNVDYGKYHFLYEKIVNLNHIMNLDISSTKMEVEYIYRDY